jgi:uncharacterized phage-associated protein
MTLPEATPPYEAKALANVILGWAERDGLAVTPLKLQKLLFFMHADYLVATGRPLCRDQFEAWTYGPVLPAVYDEFRSFSQRPITSMALVFDPIAQTRRVACANIPQHDLDQIRRSYDVYAPVSAGALSQRSHRPGGPWAEALKAFETYENIGRRISNELIVRCHRADA